MTQKSPHVSEKAQADSRVAGSRRDLRRDLIMTWTKGEQLDRCCKGRPPCCHRSPSDRLLESLSDRLPRVDHRNRPSMKFSLYDPDAVDWQVSGFEGHANGSPINPFVKGNSLLSARRVCIVNLKSIACF